MEEVINRLIEVDKAARKRVSKAKKASLKSATILEEKKKEAENLNDEEFEKTISKLKEEQEAEVEQKKKEIEQYTAESVAKLEKSAQEGKSDWISQILAEVTK